MVNYDDYYRISQRADQYAALAVLFGVLFAIFLILFFVAAAMHATERDRRKALQAELDRVAPAVHELTLIRALGEAGRQEVWRAAAEAQQAMALLAVGRR